MSTTKTLTHRGYTAEYQWDDDSQRFVARIIDIDAIIHFEAQDEQELIEEMTNSVVAYEEFLEDLAEWED